MRKNIETTMILFTLFPLGDIVILPNIETACQSKSIISFLVIKISIVSSIELDILAPSLLEYEVINGLIIAKKRGRIQEKKILSAIDGFISLEIKMINLSLFYPKVIHYSKIYSRSAYDASYLALADDEDISLVTADKGLYNVVRKDLKWVEWLGDFKLPE